jgi:hypothetical protein
MPKLNLPFLRTSDNPLIGTTQSQIPIVDIIENITLFKDGGAALVLESTSLNFGLLSEREQEAVVAAYAALINSLSFHTQILVRTQKKDVSRYIEQLEKRIPQISNPKLQQLMGDYKAFISETIKKKNVLGKRFFIIIPFSAIELGINTKSLNPLANKKQETLPYTKDYIIKKALIALNPKRDHLIRQAQRLGLKLRQLTNQELLILYYDIYNPDIQKFQVRKEDILDEARTTEAKPAISGNTQATSSTVVTPTATATGAATGFTSSTDRPNANPTSTSTNSIPTN